MRTHRVERFLDDFERLHAKLTSELIILPTFPEGGELSSLLGEWTTRSAGVRVVDTLSSVSIWRHDHGLLSLF